ncbi:MAG: SIS domain-containing protein [Acidobacteriota bacterium]
MSVSINEGDGMQDLDPDKLCSEYLERVISLMRSIAEEEADALDKAAERLADQIAMDRMVHVFGPGGHSNLASQELFFRAGGLMHISAILDEGTLLSNGALRSMAIERVPGYGKVVIADQNLGKNDVLILVNAYGINAALIDAALEAKCRGCFVIGVSSRKHASSTGADHPARHPTKQNLHDLVDIAIDTKIAVGDALMTLPGLDVPVGASSTFANSIALNCLALRTTAKLLQRGITPPVWKSGNAPGGDESNARFIDSFRSRMRSL